jgi:hypothetical protein
MDVQRRDLPSVPAMIGVVWVLLDRLRGRGDRPRVSDLAGAIRWPVRRLRREWRAHGRPSLRSLVSFGCVTYARQLISEGVKPSAAVVSAGLKSYWNFNRQSKQYSLGTAKQARRGPISQFDATTIRAEGENALAASNEAPAAPIRVLPRPRSTP